MLSKTLKDGLTSYAVGAKLRALRLRKKLGLVDLGKHTGLSPALLSKIETGKLFPTLPTLLRIAMTFGVGLEYFFAVAESQPVLSIVKRRERKRFPETPDAKTPSYHFESLDFPAKDRRLSAYYAEFHPIARESVRLHKHGGVELLYLVKGSLELIIGADAHTLQEGDAIYFDASVPHGYRRTGRNACAAIVVSAP